MNYNTNYRIIKTKTKEVVHMNTSSACFASFNMVSTSDQAQFVADRTMEIYQPDVTLEPRMEVVNRWIEDLNSLGFSIITSTIEVKPNDPTYPSYLHLKFPKVTKFYQFDLDFSKYTSKGHLKLALYLLRFIYEDRMPVVLDELYRLKDISPDECIWELFQLASMNKSSEAMSGHYLLNTYNLLKIVSREELNKLIYKWIGKAYTGGEMMEVDRLACSSIPPLMRSSVMKEYNANKSTITLEEYKKLIKTPEKCKKIEIYTS